MIGEGLTEEVITSESSVEPTEKFAPEIEEASENFTKALRVFKVMVNNTKNRKSLVRVLNAAAEFPLGASYPKLLNENEKRLFALFQDISSNRATILTGFLHKEFMKEGEENGRDNKEGELVAEDRNSSEEREG